jgi:hypothetical protein
MRAYDGGRNTGQGHVLSARRLRCCKKYHLIQTRHVRGHGGYHHFSYFPSHSNLQQNYYSTSPGHGAKE